MRLILEQLDVSGAVGAQIRCADTGELFASLVDGSVGDEPLGAGWIDAIGESPRVVVRCGEPLASTSGDTSGDEAGDAARWLTRWSQEGWTRFDEQVAELNKMVQEAGKELIIRPSSEGMLSDAICTLAWARRFEDLGCSVLLDPVGWLVGSMMHDAQDHLQRIDEFCAQCPNVFAVLIRSVVVDEHGGLVEASLFEAERGEGAIEPNVILKALSGVIESAPALAVLDRADLDSFL